MQRRAACALLAAMPDEQRVSGSRAGRDFWVGPPARPGRRGGAVAHRQGRGGHHGHRAARAFRRATRIVFTGVAGGLRPACESATCGRRHAAAARPGRLADLSRATKCRCTAPARFAADAALSDALAAAACALRDAGACSAGAAGDRPQPRAPRPGGQRRPLRLAPPPRAQALRTALPDALAVEMEGAAVAQVLPRLRRAVRRGAHDLGPRRRPRASALEGARWSAAAPLVVRAASARRAGAAVAPARLPPRFVDPALAAGQTLALPPGAARHVQVLRLQPGEPLTLFNGCGGEWPAAVVAHRPPAGRGAVCGRRRGRARTRTAVTLALGMPANERMDALVEKAAELGAACDPAAGLRALGGAPGRRTRSAQAGPLAGGRGGGQRAVRPRPRAACAPIPRCRPGWPRPARRPSPRRAGC